MTANFNKKYFVKQFTYFGLFLYVLGYIAYIRNMYSLLPIAIIFGLVFLFSFCMWIRSFFRKAIELNEQVITIFFLFSKRKYSLSSILDVNLDKKQIYILNDRGKKIKYTLNWVIVSDLLKLKEILKTS